MSTYAPFIEILKAAMSILVLILTVTLLAACGRAKAQTVEDCARIYESELLAGKSSAVSNYYSCALPLMTQ